MGKDRREKESMKWKIHALKKRNDPVEILEFICENGCKLHYPLESVLLTEDCTFKQLMQFCIAGNEKKSEFLVDRKKQNGDS